MLEKLDHASEGESGGLFSTHPSAEDRIDNVEDAIDDSEKASEAQAVRKARFKKNMKILL